MHLVSFLANDISWLSKFWCKQPGSDESQEEIRRRKSSVHHGLAGGDGDGARVDDDAGQRRPRGEGEAGSQAQGPQTTCGAQEVRCLLLLCFACTAVQSLTISTSTVSLW